jgi:hypothetical protein
MRIFNDLRGKAGKIHFSTPKYQKLAILAACMQKE